MSQTLANVTLVVRDYDEAIAYFTGALGFKLIEDAPLGGGKRWVVVAPDGDGTGLLLARAASPEQEAGCRQPDRRSRRILPAYRQFRP